MFSNYYEYEYELLNKLTNRLRISQFVTLLDDNNIGSDYAIRDGYAEVVARESPNSPILRLNFLYNYEIYPINRNLVREEYEKNTDLYLLTNQIVSNVIKDMNRHFIKGD